MAYIWAGGEDTSFPNGTAPTIITTGGSFNSGYARCAVGTGAGTGVVKSKVFAGGEVTSCWFSCYHYFGGAPATSQRLIGLGKSGGTKGIFIGTGSATTKFDIATYDGTTRTELAAEAGNSRQAGLNRFDLQLVAYGAASTIRLYYNGALIIDWTGDSSIAGVTGFDSIFIPQGGASTYHYSELMVDSADSRSFRLFTAYPNAAGDALDWTGGYGNIDEITTSDADLTYTDADAQDAQFNMSDTPAGTFSVHGIKIEARALKTNDASVGTLKLGVKSAGTVDVDAGQALSTAWDTYERWAATINGSQLSMALMDAIQLNLRSAV